MVTPNDAPVGTPVYGATLKQGWSRFWRGYVSFEGRASPSEFWWSYLISAAVTYVLAMVYVVVSMVALVVPFFTTYSAIANDDPGSAVAGPLASLGILLGGAAPMLLWSLAILLPTYAVMARRLRDAGFSPWLVLLSLVVPIVPVALCGFETKVNGVALGTTPALAYGQPVAQPAPGQYGPPTQTPTPYGQPSATAEQRPWTAPGA